MGKSAVLRYLNSMVNISPIKAQLILSKFNHFELKKGDMLLKEGQISRKSHLLVEGYIRSFVIDMAGNEVTTGIISAQHFANDFSSYFIYLSFLYSVMPNNMCAINISNIYFIKPGQFLLL